MKKGYYEEKLLELLDLSIRREAQVSAVLENIRDVLDCTAYEKSNCPDRQDWSM